MTSDATMASPALLVTLPHSRLMSGMTRHQPNPKMRMPTVNKGTELALAMMTLPTSVTTNASAPVNLPRALTSLPMRTDETTPASTKTDSSVPAMPATVVGSSPGMLVAMSVEKFIMVGLQTTCASRNTTMKNQAVPGMWAFSSLVPLAAASSASEGGSLKQTTKMRRATRARP